MNKRIVASFTLFAFLSLGAPVFAAPSVGADSSVVIERTWGDVEGRDGDFRAGESLKYNQTLKVGSESGATLAFPTGSRIRVSPNSEFRVSEVEGKPTLYLLSGKILASTTDTLQVQTFRANAVANSGEFVLSTTPTGTALQVLSGNARMVSSTDDATTFQRLSSLPSGIADNALQAFDDLKSHQTVGETTFGAQPQEKGKMIAQADDQQGGGLEKGLRPDQDLSDDEEKAAGISDGGSTAGSGSGSGTGSSASSSGSGSGAGTGSGVAGGSGGGSAWPYAIGGIIGLGAVIAIASDNEDEDPLGQGGNNFNVPSPSFP